MSLCYVEFGKPMDDYCEASSYSFGVGSSGFLAGTNRQASMHDLTFTKAYDSMSRKIWQASMNGNVFDTVWVEFYRDEYSDPYGVYTLRDVVVSSVSTHGSRDTVGLNFKTMKSDFIGR